MNFRTSRLAAELALSLLLLVAGLVAVPAAVFAVGSKLFGVYAGGLAAFFTSYTNDLAGLRLSAWTLALGPLLWVWLIRLLIGGWRSRSSDDDDVPPARVEPSIRS